MYHGIYKCDALRDLVPFLQVKKSEKQPRRRVTFCPMSVFTFFKLYKWYQIAQNIINAYQINTSLARTGIPFQPSHLKDADNF